MVRPLRSLAIGFFSAHSKKRGHVHPPWPAIQPQPAIQVQPPTPEQSADTSVREGPPPAKKVKRNAAEEAQPLAERMRPKSLRELIGHEDLVGENGVLRELILTDRVPSMILWAGPGVHPSFARGVDVRSGKRLSRELSRIRRNHGSRNLVRRLMV